MLTLCLHKAVHDCVSILGLGDKVRAWPAKFHGERRGSHWLFAAPNRLPLVGQAIATCFARGGRKLLRHFHQRFCLELPYLQYNTDVTSTRNRSPSNESFWKPSSLSFPHCPSGCCGWRNPQAAKFTGKLGDTGRPLTRADPRRLALAKLYDAVVEVIPHSFRHGNPRRRWH